MPVTILIPTPLRRFVGGSQSLEVIAETVQGALTMLADRNPELRQQLFDDQGHVRSFVNVFLGNDNVRDLAPAGGAVALHDGDVLTVLLAIAGGAPTANEL